MPTASSPAQGFLNPRDLLSEHFRVSEFAQHDHLVTTPQVQLIWLRALCVVFLEPLRSRFGPVHVLSGYRSPAYNAGVHGAPESYHTCRPPRPGAAADVQCKTGAPPDWHAFLDERGANGLGLYLTWVHVDNRAGHARW